jgi:uncharacterized delta-60 repeat protein
LRIRRGARVGSMRAARWLAAVVFLLPLLLAAPASGVAGDLDPAFDGGKVVTAFADGAAANGVATHRGRIVVVGATGDLFAVARYLRDGTLDATFGGNGKVITDFRGPLATARAVDVQADGKIVVVGDADNFRRFAVARYRKNGTLDTTFGGDGKVTTRIWPGGNAARAVAIASNGRIVVAGQTSGPEGSAIAVVRYLPDGSLDASFGRHGKVTTQFRGSGAAYGVAVTHGGKVTVVGEAAVPAGFRLARYLTDGRLDATFGRGGKVASHKPGGARAVALQPDGKIVVAGIGGDIFGPFAVERFLRDGRVDTAFSGNGRVVVSMGDGEESGQSVAIDADGRILVAGYTNVPHEFGDTGNGAFALVRFRPRGHIDQTFGVGGKVLTEFAEGLALGTGLALQGNGKIVVAGWAGGNFGVARYLPA